MIIFNNTFRDMVDTAECSAEKGLAVYQIIAMRTVRRVARNGTPWRVHQSRAFGLAVTSRVPDAAPSENTTARATVDQTIESDIRNRRALGIDQRYALTWFYCYK